MKTTTRHNRPVQEAHAPAGSLTTEEVMERTGKTRDALFSWARRKFISGPVVQKVPKGRGRRALWMESVVDQIKALDELAARGVPLEIAKQQIWLQGTFNSSLRYGEMYALAQEWAAPSTAGDLPVRLGLEDPNASLRECFIFAIVRLARLAGLSQAIIERVEWIAAEHLVSALMNFVMGSDPVFVVAPDGSFVAPRAALGTIYAQPPDSDPDEWAPLAASGFESPAPWAQRPVSRWFPVFTVLDLGPVMRTLWRLWGKPVGAAFGNRELQYQSPPIVWHRVGDDVFESDAVLTTWGREPYALVLDVAPLTTRKVSRSVPQLALEDATRRWEQGADARAAELKANQKLWAAKSPEGRAPLADLRRRLADEKKK